MSAAHACDPPLVADQPARQFTSVSHVFGLSAEYCIRAHSLGTRCGCGRRLGQLRGDSDRGRTVACGCGGVAAQPRQTEIGERSRNKCGNTITILTITSIKPSRALPFGYACRECHSAPGDPASIQPRRALPFGYACRECRPAPGRCLRPANAEQQSPSDQPSP